MKQLWIKRSLIGLLAIVILVPVLLLSYMSFFQESFLFHEQRTGAGEVFTNAAKFEDVWMELNGQKIHSVFFSQPESRTLILYFHGNSGTIFSHWGGVAADLSQKLGVSVWMMDFPGFGQSEGHIRSQEQLMNMAEMFFDDIPKHGNFNEIILYGRSMGTGIASQLAALEGPDKVAGVVLEAPFSSLTQLVHEIVPWVPSSLLRYSFDSKEALGIYPGPLLIFHGDKDEVIPVHHGRELAASRAPDQVVYHEIPGAGHDSLRTYDIYWSSMKELLAFAKPQDETLSPDESGAVSPTLPTDSPSTTPPAGDPGLSTDEPMYPPEDGE